MNLSKKLGARLREVYLDGTWVANTNYQKILSDVDKDMALSKVGNLNTIAMLTFHINYYLKGLLQVFDEGKLEIKDTYSFDLPPIKSEDDWQKLVNEFLTNAERFIQIIQNLSDEEVLSPFIEEKYGTYERNIEGILEHSYYHLGQMSLIKKQINFINTP